MSLLVAAVVGGSSWLVDRANPSLIELHDRLTAMPLSGDEVPPGLTFQRWAKDPDGNVAQEGDLYAAAYFEERGGLKRAAFALYPSSGAAREAFEVHEEGDRYSAESSAAIVRSGRKWRATAFFPTVPAVEHPSFCRTERDYGECVAWVGRVVVIGEARSEGAPELVGIQTEPRGPLVKLAAELLRGGIRRAERFY